MLKLFIDIGNTNSTMALVKGKKIRRRYFIHTNKKNIEAKSLRRLFNRNIENVSEIVIVSVVPKFLVLLKKKLRQVFKGIPIKIVGKDIKVPITIRYSPPGSVGMDRVVVSYAAKERYGVPLVVIDFGTAVTFDFVGKKGEYQGGLIFPGLRVSLGSLIENTALLPNIDVTSPVGLIGKNTFGSMNKGIVYGYAALCDGIIVKFKAKYGKDLVVVATGGDAKLIASKAREIDHVRPNLILEGLSLLS